MMKRNTLLLLCLALCTLCVTAQWQPDVLGQGFEMQYVQQPDDYSGKVRCTVVRHLAQHSDSIAVLYVHGYNDYFFQSEMAQQFSDRGYDFYAVDLRKYGRSILPGQRKFELRDISEYYADIDSAVSIIARSGIKRIVLMGHSTGGLITSCYMSATPSKDIKALILNSPFLDWNQSKFQEKFLIPMVRSVSGILPSINIEQGDDDTYAASLLKDMKGEWTYNTDWKLVHSPAVQTSWIGAIDAAQDIIQNHPGIKVPILLLHSDASYHSGDSPDKALRSDAVLDVEDISRYGRQLGPQVTEAIVPGGLHDLALSRPAVRKAMFNYIFGWLDRNGLD